jgi:hypothetical protein
MIDQVLTMGMLDILSFNGYEVLRVPGGWMFTLQTTSTRNPNTFVQSSCFVPDPYYHQHNPRSDYEEKT